MCCRQSLQQVNKPRSSPLGFILPWPNKLPSTIQSSKSIFFLWCCVPRTGSSLRPGGWRTPDYGILFWCIFFDKTSCKLYVDFKIFFFNFSICVFPSDVEGELESTQRSIIRLFAMAKNDRWWSLFIKIGHPWIWLCLFKACHKSILYKTISSIDK